MQLEVGKKYRTRDGRNVTITQIDGWDDPLIQYPAKASGDGIMGYYSRTGKFIIGLKSDRDLVEEVTD